jgi:hypothetical protein
MELIIVDQIGWMADIAPVKRYNIFLIRSSDIPEYNL